MSSAQGAETGKETAQFQTGGLEVADSRLVISAAGQRKYTLGVQEESGPTTPVYRRGEANEAMEDARSCGR